MAQKSQPTHIGKPLYAMLKKPTAQIAHLVFADTQANTEKLKELFFCQRLTRTEIELNEQTNKKIDAE